MKIKINENKKALKYKIIDNNLLLILVIKKNVNP